MDGDWSAVEVVRERGQGRVVLVCEHASAHIPPELNALGLDEAARFSHAAWDIGALDVAVALSRAMDAPLVAGGVSRLVYDCNRPLEAPDCVPERSEIHAVPGNQGLGAEVLRARFDRVHEPFHAAVEAVLAERPRDVAVVTIHSFTPVFRGERRALELGFLHHVDARFARIALEIERARGRYAAALDQPYSAADGVTHTLARHAHEAGRQGLMVEIRNDLIATPEGAGRLAAHLAETLETAMDRLARDAA